ncbi:hypothetical protein [Actinomadura flavalba]|uniref:hypothetical protein n=1 Tax=Actinomadura flavalba TaxID=1120938 RepID=UPI00035F5024|nr:hypothetical protein [Actinomadura flavalba]
MYAWIWRHLPGSGPKKLMWTMLAVLVVVAALWYVVFPWLEPKLQFDHGVVTPASTPPGGG